MADTEENSSLFLIFILTIMALPLVPYTIVRICQVFLSKTKSINCECAVCSQSGKYRKSIFKRISNFSTCSNLTLVLLWVIMVILVYYIKHINRKSQPFEPFSILGLEPGASDTEIKKAYRRLSILYHPDENPDPDAHKYFVEFISKHTRPSLILYPVRTLKIWPPRWPSGTSNGDCFTSVLTEF